MLVGAGRVETVETTRSRHRCRRTICIISGRFHAAADGPAKAPLHLPTIHAASTGTPPIAGSLWQKIRDDVDAESLESIQEGCRQKSSFDRQSNSPDFIDAALESDLRLAGQ